MRTMSSLGKAEKPTLEAVGVLSDITMGAYYWLRLINSGLLRKMTSCKHLDMIDFWWCD